MTPRCFDTCGCGHFKAATMSPTERSPPASATSTRRRFASATALKTSVVVAARGMGINICPYRHVSRNVVLQESPTLSYFPEILPVAQELQAIPHLLGPQGRCESPCPTEQVSDGPLTGDDEDRKSTRLNSSHY